MVKIGERIRKLRISKELTQEKLSEILGVSPQAISRWENDITYPDINMLPSIATFFSVSVDELLGMEDLRSEKEIARIHNSVHKLIESGEVYEAVDELREALKQYPNDYGFMCELALALSLYQDYNVSSSNLEEAIDISEGILGRCVNDKIRSTIKANLCFVYLKSGNEKVAVNLANTLPHVWESRELLLPEINLLGFNKETFRKGIEININVIYSKIMSSLETSNTDTSKMLMLGPDEFKSISFDEKMKYILEYMN